MDENGPRDAAPRTTRLGITGMTCANCVDHVRHALERVEGVQRADVNLATESATVTHAPDVDRDVLQGAVERSGYGVAGEDAEADARGLERRRLVQTVIAAAFTAPIFFYTMVWIPFLDGPMLPGDGWIVWLMATPVQFYSGAVFYRGAWIAIRNRSATMDTLVVIGTSAAYFLSAAMVLAGRHAHDTYFETAAVIITLVGLGKYFEARAKRSTRAAVARLMEMGARTARRIRGDGATEEVPVEEVRVGDRLLVKPGEKVPVDGRVVEGTAHADESMVTGESVPVAKEAGDQVIGATIVQGGALTVEAMRVGEDTLLAQIARLVEEANARKAPIQRLVDRVSGIFVPIVVVLALAAFLFWISVGSGLWPHPDLAPGLFATLVAITVLVISCPCALGLATPTAIMMGTGLGARHGILIKGGEALENVRRVTCVVLDKTGTVTEGHPGLAAVEHDGDLDRDFFLALAAAVEERSEHPLAEAVVRGARKRGLEAFPVARDFRSEPGRGVTATVDGVDVAIGSRRFLHERGVDLGDWPARMDAHAEEGRTAVAVAFDGKGVGLLALEDPVRPTSRDAVARLAKKGLRVVLLTGDNERVARAVASQVGIHEVRAEVLPQDKSDIVGAFQEQGEVVAMVGDGVNDAPAMAQADVGIAMGTGTDVAKETGDIVLVKGDLAHAVAALDLGRYTVRKVHQNLFWAFAYNATLIPVAMGVLYPFTAWLLNPMLAGAAMAFSSVSVVGNTLLMRGWKGLR